MNSMVEDLLNPNLPDHERLGVTPAAPPAEVREAVARLRRALLDPHLTDDFRQQGQLILSDLAPRLHGGPLPPIAAAPPPAPVPPKAKPSEVSELHLTVFDRQLLALLSRGGFRGSGRRKILTLAQRHRVKPEQLANIMLGLAEWTQAGRGRSAPANGLKFGLPDASLPFDHKANLRLAVGLSIFLLVSVGILFARWWGSESAAVSPTPPQVAVLEVARPPNVAADISTPTPSKILRWDRPPGLFARARPEGARAAAAGLRSIRTALRAASAQAQPVENTELVRFVDQLGLAWLAVSDSERDAVVRELLPVLLWQAQENPVEFGRLVRSLSPARAPEPELPNARARLEVLVELERSSRMPTEVRSVVQEAISRALGESTARPSSEPKTEWLVRSGQRLVEAMNNERDRSQAAARWMALLPTAEASRVEVVIEVLHTLLRTRRVLEEQSPNGLMDFLGSMLSVLPAGHPDLRELVVRCHRDPTVRSGTIWALGSYFASQRWGGFFDGRLVLDHLGLVGVDRQASRERLARRISEAWPTQWTPAKEEKAFWSDFVADWRVLRDRIDGDGSSGLTRAGRLAHLNRLGLEALLGSLTEARRGLDANLPSALLLLENPNPMPPEADTELINRLQAARSRSARRNILEQAEPVVASRELANLLLDLIAEGSPTERRAAEDYLHRGLTDDPAILVALSDRGLDFSDRFLRPFFGGDMPAGRQARAAQLLVRAALPGLPDRRRSLVALAEAWASGVQDPLPALDALLLRVPNLNPPLASPRTVTELLERRRDAVQALADHAIRRGWLDSWDVKAVFRDRALRRQRLRHPEAILSDLEWTESELLDRALAVRRDGRRLDRAAPEDASDVPMQVPSEFQAALEGLRPNRPDRYFDLAEVVLDGGDLSLARWLSGIAAGLDPKGFAASTALLYASTSESPLEIERYRRLAKALGANGLTQRNEDLIQLADAMRAARRASSDIPVRALKYVASEPRDAFDPSLLVLEAWCRFGDRVVDPLLALRAGLRPLPEVFPTRLELEFDGDPSQAWFRRGKWTGSPILNPNTR